MMDEALYGCQFADCAVDVSYPAHMLKMLNGAPVCEDCVDDMGKVDWLDLEKFVPPEQAKITDLQAKLDKAVEALQEIDNIAGAWPLSGGYEDSLDLLEMCGKVSVKTLALITAKPERDE